MFSAAHINDLSRRRARILIPAFVIGVLAVLGYFAVVAFVRDSLVDVIRQRVGKTAGDFIPFGIILPAFVFFLTPVVRAEKKSKQFALICPGCGSDMTRSTERVLATRCRSSCGIRIVAGGRTRPPEVFDRHSRIKWRRSLVYLLWAWPVGGGLLVAWYWADLSRFENDPGTLLTFPLLGTATSGWALFRTRDRRYLPQLLASVLVLCVAATLLYRLIWPVA